MKTKVLIVEDEEDIQRMLRMALEREDCEVTNAGDAASLRPLLLGPQPHVVLLDLQLPDAQGLDLLPELKRQWPETEVIILTGNATISAACEAMRRGAYTFEPKPIDRRKLIAVIQRAAEGMRSHKELAQEAGVLRNALATMAGGNAPVFQSPAMKNVARIVEKVAGSDISVLLTGESGVGKEVVADLTHALSPRARGPLIKVNCAALPRELIESELFGSVKGAYTGAQSDREGLFRQADGGTLLLDEISEMPMDTQSKLLRVLQEKEVRPVGGKSSFKVDVRVVAATNRLPQDAIRDHKLREDLFYRISAVSIAIPPLRERREDIMPLASSFLQRFAAQANSPLRGFSPAAQELIKESRWPGNVRQLQNAIQRAVLMCDGDVIDVKDLEIAPPVVGPDLEAGEADDLSLVQAMERRMITQVIKDTRGNKAETAKRLGWGRQTLYNKMQKYGIEG